MEDLFGKNNVMKYSPVGKKKSVRRTTELTEIDVVDEYRRCYGVYELCKCMMDKPVAGKSYHFLTGGNVDLLAHMQWLMLHWKRLKRVFISAWAISGVDILLCQKWLEAGEIGELELLLGDIFPTKYKMEWKKLMEMYDKGIITNIFKSTIHSKVMLLEAEDGTKVVVESSANCNMNPRVEQSCVTVSDKLFDFYDVYLHEILNDEEARFVARESVKLSKDQDGEIDIDERAALEWED